MVVQANGSECRASTHAKNTTNVSELKTMYGVLPVAVSSLPRGHRAAAIFYGLRGAILTPLKFVRHDARGAPGVR